MKIDDIKNRMIAYSDHYGNDLLHKDDIKHCKSKSELRNIITLHKKHMEDMLNYAENDLDRLLRETGLDQSE